MLEKIGKNPKPDRKESKEIYKVNCEKLSELQRQCREENIPVTIVFEGLDGTGKGYQIGRFIYPLDPRFFSVHAMNREREEEAAHPFLWRYWNRIPKLGEIAVFDRSWYRRVSLDRFDLKPSMEEVEKAYRDILAFERQLSDSGMVIIKIFLYISKKEQKKRFEELESHSETRWKVGEGDWLRHKKYEEYLKINEEMLERTDVSYAPWTIVEAEDDDWASAQIISAAVDSLEAAIKRKQHQSAQPVYQGESGFHTQVLKHVDLSRTMERDEYKKRLRAVQKRLEVLHNEIFLNRIPVIAAFEGWDAAGKGGAIKRLTEPMDPRGYEVCTTAAPKDLEKQYHYLWRFWSRFPKNGHIAIFDRTWYGRVMVERIEGFCTEAEWKRAYREINEMEEHLTSSGVLLLKFWLHIDKDEQERRFKERMEIPSKQWKITEEDWRNREKWDDYERAVDEMLVRTSTTYAPWTIVEGNSKYYARIKVLETVADKLEEGLKKKKGK
ncbi:polyphosphate:AMP phosphotransferase [Anaerolentibacter hominis]|uniref:polyphosphate:AMP phosphotransferase n=1 Tax=Anaerolentibacter hominis TaxID=3079009 RepID=UPI0031B8240D